MPCDVITLSDGPVCATCGCADPRLFGTKKICVLPNLTHEPHVELATGRQMALAWGGAIVGSCVFWYVVYHIAASLL